MNVTRALAAQIGFLMTFGMAATGAADPGTQQSFDVRTSRSVHLFLSNASETPRGRTRMGKQKRIRLRYDQPVQVGGSDIVLRFNAPLKKKKLLAFEVIF
jgi:hypothetical protein